MIYDATITRSVTVSIYAMRSIREYTEAVRGRYLLVSKAENGKTLDEFTKAFLTLENIRADFSGESL